jgi:hypothetical protein
MIYFSTCPKFSGASPVVAKNNCRTESNYKTWKPPKIGRLDQKESWKQMP